MGRVFLQFESSMPSHSFKICPNSPNCVSSLSTHQSHAVDPLEYRGDWRDAKQGLLELIESLPRAKIEENLDEYVHAVFKSRIFGFADDVEFVFDDAQKVIHIRSASRFGYYDFGVNRQRVEMLRARLSA